MTYSVSISEEGMFEAWRAAARQALSHNIAPHVIDWSGVRSLFETHSLPDARPNAAVTVPQQFMKLARSVIWHSDPARFGLLYQAIWRLHRREGNPISQIDPLGRKLHLLAKAVSRDIHKMHAFVRFRELPSGGPRRNFAAWFEPDHFITEPASSFFVKRFADMNWMIATPHRTAHYKDGQLTFSNGTQRPALSEDSSEALWAIYFANIFNPARVKLNAMRSEMPKKYWGNLPETRLIPSMLANAEARVERMRKAGASAARPGAEQVSTRYRARMLQAPDKPQTLEEARAASMQCRRCDLCEAATQTVWGEGSRLARAMIVGEQPGDMEDLAGRPFVGPAGQLLRATLQEIGVAPTDLYLTNAVKHFKFKTNGKRRLHDTASKLEVRHCRWWLEMEIEMVKPEIIVALGATAAFSLTGSAVSIAKRRGTLHQASNGIPVVITWHPSYILRTRDLAEKTKILNQLKIDLSFLNQ